MILKQKTMIPKDVFLKLKASKLNNKPLPVDITGIYTFNHVNQTYKLKDKANKERHNRLNTNRKKIKSIKKADFISYRYFINLDDFSDILVDYREKTLLIENQKTTGNKFIFNDIAYFLYKSPTSDNYIIQQIATK